MGMIAYQSNQLEGAGWDQWALHQNALLEAYRLGKNKSPLLIYHFLKWHKAILPFGGILRESMPVSMGMGESFNPKPVSVLPAWANAFVQTWTQRVLQSPTFLTLAELHFEQWAAHAWADGNKRHCRLLTVYGCGLINANPVCITLGDKSTYINALDASDIECLAGLLESRQVQW